MSIVNGDLNFVCYGFPLVYDEGIFIYTIMTNGHKLRLTNYKMGE